MEIQFRTLEFQFQSLKAPFQEVLYQLQVQRLTAHFQLRFQIQKVLYQLWLARSTDRWIGWLRTPCSRPSSAKSAGDNAAAIVANYNKCQER